MYFYTYCAGIVSGVLVHKYRWKLGFLLLKSAVNTKTMLVNYFKKNEDIIIPTAVDNVEEHIFNNGTNIDNNSHDYRKIYLIGDDIYSFKDEKNKYLSYADEFLCCFLKSYDNGEDLLDVSSQLKKSIFYMRTSPSVRSAFTIQTFLDVCQFDDQTDHDTVELLWIDKDLNEKTKTITKEDRKMDIYYVFNE